MNAHLRNIHRRGGKKTNKKNPLCPFKSLYAASGEMFKFLIGFFEVYLVEVFYLKCVIRVFHVMHHKIKPHLVVKADLVAWI